MVQDPEARRGRRRGLYANGLRPAGPQVAQGNQGRRRPVEGREVTGHGWRTMRQSIVIAGSLAQRPHHGGHTWVFLQYLLGFRRLGWDVLFLDRLEPGMCFDDWGQECGPEDSVALRYFLDVMRRFGLGESFALAWDRGERFVGHSRKEVLERVKGSALLLNVMGFFDDAEVLAAAPLKAF